MAVVPASDWPERIWIVRHGQSAGNLARDSAENGGLVSIDIPERDADVPLSELGHRQARALGQWFAGMAAEAQPNLIVVSPYRRARQTADAVAAALSPEGVHVRADERLRERDLGSLDRLTRTGWTARYPEQADVRTRLGKFYYRPPGGESWCDVVLRLRSLVEELRQRRAGGRVLIVAHQVVVLCFRYILEGLDEAELLRIDASGDVPNCAVTIFEKPPGANSPDGMVLKSYNDVMPVRGASEPATSSPDVTVAPR